MLQSHLAASDSSTAQHSVSKVRDICNVVSGRSGEPFWGTASTQKEFGFIHHHTRNITVIGGNNTRANILLAQA